MVLESEEIFYTFYTEHLQIKISAIITPRSNPSNQFVITSMNLTLLYLCHFTPKLFYFNDSGMCKNFALIRKSRMKKLTKELGNKYIHVDAFCLFLQNFLFSI